MTKWKVSYIDGEAARELLTFMENEDVGYEIKRIIKILASQQDPRRPSKSVGLIVEQLNMTHRVGLELKCLATPCVLFLGYWSFVKNRLLRLAHTS